jgi:hypothetical protein
LATPPNPLRQTSLATISDRAAKTKIQEEEIIMAAGAAPAPEKKAETKMETSDACEAQPLNFKQRMKLLLSRIFEGREEHLGWHQ